MRRRAAWDMSRAVGSEELRGAGVVRLHSGPRLSSPPLTTYQFQPQMVDGQTPGATHEKP